MEGFGFAALSREGGGSWATPHAARSPPPSCHREPRDGKRAVLPDGLKAKREERSKKPALSDPESTGSDNGKTRSPKEHS